MPSTYTGNPANNPASITIPSDGDGPGIHAADVNVAFEALADQIAHNASTASSALATETAARIAADSAEATARAAADSTEASARAAADSSEASTRAAADTALNTLIMARTPFYVHGANSLVGKSGLHTFPNPDSFGVANQLGICDSGGVDTPFTAGVVAGDILKIDFSLVLGFPASDNNIHSYRLMYSETATDFVSGTWAPVSGASISQRTLIPPGAAAGITLELHWSAILMPAGTTGHVRFAIACNQSGATSDNSGGSGGRYEWLRNT